MFPTVTCLLGTCRLREGLPQQHRIICGIMLRVSGIYSQGVFSLLDLVDLVVKHCILWGNKKFTQFISHSTQCPQLHCRYFMYQRMKKRKKGELGLGILSFISWIRIVPIHKNSVWDWKYAV